MKKSLFILPLAAMALAACDLSAITDLIPFWPKGDTTQSSSSSKTSSSKSSSSSSKTSSSSSSSKTSSSSSSTSGSEDKSPMQIAYEAAVDLASGEETSAKYTFDGVVTAKTKNCFYVQDGDYALYVFSSKPTTGLAVGKKVSVTSTMKNYNNLPETGTVDSITVVGDGKAVSAKSVSSMSELSELSHNYLISVDLKLTEIKAEWSTSAHGIFKFDLGGEEVEVRCDKYGYSENAAAAATLNGGTVGQTYHLTNVIKSVFKEKTQIAFTGTSSIS